MQLKLLKKDCEEWRSFLKKNEHLIIHTPEWKSFIEDTFYLTKSKYYIIKAKDRIKLIFPTFSTTLAMNSNMSVPFLEYGAYAGDVPAKEFNELAKHLPMNTKIHSGLDCKHLKKYFIEVKEHKKFILPLKTEEVLWKHIHKFKRKAVRLSEKSGIVVRDIDVNELDELYRLYLRSMKFFGTPPNSKKYFKNFYKYFVNRNLAKVLGAYYDGKLVAMLAGFTVSNRIHVNINVSDVRYLKYRINDAVYWEFIKWGCNNNFKEFDFGIVWAGRGQFAFKKKWNAELRDLPNYYLRSKKTSKPFYFEYDVFSFIWKYIPTPIAALIGQPFREFIGI
jgi:hypothetical protein